MNLTGSSKELLLVHASMKSVSLSQSVNVMLTPQFYTLKKEALPVKYLYQAKRVAHSLFDGLLEEGRNYNYFVFKEGKEWVFIAYDLAKITDFLVSKGINPQQVSKLFFAQQILSSFSKPLSLGEREALVVINDIVVVVPKIALEDEIVTFTFNNKFTPKMGVGLHDAYGSLLSLKHSIALVLFFILFAGMFIVEGWRYANASKDGAKELEILFEQYPSLQSQYARKSIAEKYKNIDSIERRKRETIKSLSGMIFKGVTLTSLKLNEKGFNAEFACESAKVSKELKALAKQKRFNIVEVSKSNNLKIEGRL